jgi:hypothetical protein
LREAIEECDLFVYLLSPETVAAGSYALAELGLIQARWPHPRGRVLPVKLAPTPLEAVPPYLKAVTMYEPQGDPVPGVVARLRACRRDGGTLLWIALPQRLPSSLWAEDGRAPTSARQRGRAKGRAAGR